MWDNTVEGIRKNRLKMEAILDEFRATTDEYQEYFSKEFAGVFIENNNMDKYGDLSPTEKWELIKENPTEGDLKMQKYFDDNPEKKNAVFRKLTEYIEEEWMSPYASKNMYAELPKGVEKVRFNEDSLIVGEFTVMAHNHKLFPIKGLDKVRFKLYYMVSFIFKNGENKYILIENFGQNYDVVSQEVAREIMVLGRKMGYQFLPHNQCRDSTMK